MPAPDRPAPSDRLPASMADVASVAGVSHQTVSRVLNHPDKVRPETRQRVERAMAELDFRPNAAARALVTRSSRLVGVVLPGENLFGPIHTMVAVDAAARQVGYATTLGVLGRLDPVDAVLRHFVNLNVDGLVVVAHDQRTLDAAHALAQRLPVVVVAAVEAPAMASVRIDQAAAARAVVSHLAEQGAERVDHVSGPLDWFDAQQRRAGWLAALDDLGLTGREHPAGGWSARDGAHAIDGAGLPDTGQGGASGIFCANDQLALGVLHSAATRGQRVPGEVLVAGFDDVDGADHFGPGLTTVRQPFTALGSAALELLVGLIEQGLARQVVLRPQLVARSSTRR